MLLTLILYIYFISFTGQGIGRNSDGISKPIKASLKFDTAGLGHNKADEFNNHWWEKAFNDAASNINVQNASDKASLSLNNSESVEVSSITNNITTTKTNA